jgi:hypothetical protein
MLTTSTTTLAATTLLPPRVLPDRQVSLDHRQTETLRPVTKVSVEAPVDLPLSSRTHRRSESTGRLANTDPSATSLPDETTTTLPPAENTDLTVLCLDKALPLLLDWLALVRGWQVTRTPTVILMKVPRTVSSRCTVNEMLSTSLSMFVRICLLRFNVFLWLTIFSLTLQEVPTPAPDWQVVTLMVRSLSALIWEIATRALRLVWVPVTTTNRLRVFDPDLNLDQAAWLPVRIPTTAVLLPQVSVLLLLPELVVSLLLVNEVCLFSFALFSYHLDADHVCSLW